MNARSPPQSSRGIALRAYEARSSALQGLRAKRFPRGPIAASRLVRSVIPGLRVHPRQGSSMAKGRSEWRGI